MKVNNITGNDNQAFTTRYSYGNTDSEYVFTCKGRPFAVLVSDNLPPTTPNLLDFDLVSRLLTCSVVSSPCFVASDLNTLQCHHRQDEA